jgi:hypothetical protein
LASGSLFQSSSVQLIRCLGSWHWQIIDHRAEVTQSECIARQFPSFTSSEDLKHVYGRKKSENPLKKRLTFFALIGVRWAGCSS